MNHVGAGLIFVFAIELPKALRLAEIEKPRAAGVEVCECRQDGEGSEEEGWRDGMEGEASASEERVREG